MRVSTNPEFDPVAVCLFWEDLGTHYEAHGARSAIMWFHQDPIGYKKWFQSPGIAYIECAAWIACRPTGTSPSMLDWIEWGNALRLSKSFNGAVVDYAIEQMGREARLGPLVVEKIIDSLGHLNQGLGDWSDHLLDGLTANSQLCLNTYLTPEFRHACVGSQDDIISVWMRVGDRTQVDAVTVAAAVGAPRLGAYQASRERVPDISLPDLAG